MKHQINTAIFFIVYIAMQSCQKPNVQDAPGVEVAYVDTPQNITITGGKIPEASGIADSKTNPGFIWVEEDSGNPPDIYLLGQNGNIKGKVHLQDAVNIDWEDIQLSTGPYAGTSYLYIGDIGDNNAVRASCSFLRFPEPAAGTSNVNQYDKIRFNYPDGPRDAEAFLVDPSTKDIFIITKRDSQSKIYKLSYPQDTINITTATYVGSLSFSGVVSAALSANGEQLMVKTYGNLYYCTRGASQSIDTTLKGTFKKLGYQLEPQGEAVCFALDGSGFYTLSETSSILPITPTLNFYKKKQ